MMTTKKSSKRKRWIIRFVIMIALIAVVTTGAFSFLRWLADSDREYWATFTFEQAQAEAIKKPKDKSARAVFAFHLWDKHRYDEAIKEFQAESALDPPDPSPHVFMAQIYEITKRKKESRAEWGIVAKLASPGSWDKTEASNKLRLLKSKP